MWLIGAPQVYPSTGPAKPVRQTGLLNRAAIGPPSGRPGRPVGLVSSGCETPQDRVLAYTISGEGLGFDLASHTDQDGGSQ